MSLPSQAGFYKNDVRVNECFVNCGWFYDERNVLEQVKQFLIENKFDYDYFSAYGEKFQLTLSQIDTRLQELKQESKLNYSKWKQMRDSKTDEAVIPIVKRELPEETKLLLDSIAGVQPMQSSNGKIFTLRTMYENDL